MRKHSGWPFHLLNFLFKECASDLQRKVVFKPRTEAQQALFAERAKANGYDLIDFNPEKLQDMIIAVLKEKK